MEQFDRQLRDELRRRGATVIDKKGTQAAIVLRPSLDVSPRAIRLNLVGVRSADQTEAPRQCLNEGRGREP